MHENEIATAALDRAPMDKTLDTYCMEAHMRLGTKTALLSAAIGALTVSAVGSAHAEDLPAGHEHDSRPAHAGKSHHGHSDDLFVKKYHRKKHFSKVEETSRPAPVVAVPVPAGALCTQSVGNATGGTGTGNTATTTVAGAQTQTCNIEVNLPPVGSDESNQIRTESRTQSSFEEQITIIRR
ncbi:hypothetical protein [Streptomyces sp. NPDC050164]|uniref:hypothetical protein n=1 Tax=Streptomyces sp. NPDC050164 TaxID=3365605 RepID=UPI0037A19FEF